MDSRLRDVDKIPPTPHYPNWRYLCTDCKEFWETELRLDDFRLICPSCQSYRNQLMEELKLSSYSIVKEKD